MPRIRTIKPEFFTSEDVNELPMRTRLTWIGLWTQCDDHGRTKDNVKLIKAAVWPLDDEVGERHVEYDLETLAERGLVIRYEVDGRRYLAVTTWDRHQSAAYRRGESKFPAPPNSWGYGSEHPTSPSAGTGNREQGTGNASARASTTSRADRTTDRASGTTSRAEATSSDETFRRFWASYPRHVAKRHAAKAWDAAVKRGADPEHVIAAAGTYAEAVADTDPRFIKHPSTWLNGQCYDDEPDRAPEPSRPQDVTAVPPPGLSPEEYAAWEREQRRKAQ